MSIARLNKFNALPRKFEALTEIFCRILTQIRTVEDNDRRKMLLKVAGEFNDDEGLIILETWTDINAHRQPGWQTL